MEEIINGVDVSGCGYREIRCVNKKPENYCFSECGNTAFYRCIDNPNCYYKQMKKLEQENAKLKDLLETRCYNEVEFENKKLKEALEEIKEVFKKYDSEEEGTVAELLHDVFEVYSRVCEVLKDE